MHRLVLLLSLVVAVDSAHASTCGVDWSFDLSGSVPLGCPLALYLRTDFLEPPSQLVARRGSQDVDVTASHTASTTMLDVTYIRYDCDGHEADQMVRSEPYFVHAYEMSADAMVGDHLYALNAQFGGYGPISVVAAGPCTNAVPQLYCSGSDPSECMDAGVGHPNDAADVPDPYSPGDGGCSSGGGNTPMMAGLFVLPILLGRRRRFALGRA